MKTYSKASDSINQRFGRLVVIRLLNFDKFGNRRVLCICDCGKEKMATLARLKKGDTKSCGCLKIENANRQLIKASERNPLLKGKSEPKIATAKLVFRRYSDGNLTFDIFLELSQQKCFYCGCDPSNKTNYYITADDRYSKERQIKGYFTYNGLDRVDNKRGHDVDNVVPCCLPCNKAKLDRDQEEFFSWIDKVHKLHPYH